MIKLVALFRKPDEIDEFDKYFDNVFLPRIKKYPGLRDLEITVVSGAAFGESKYHRMAELYFDDSDAMDIALASPEGKAVARDMLGFAPNLVTLFHGVVETPEESRSTRA